ncbi:hypothetical protein, unlikely [Trypanosoma congolense IL3000]|uniref:Uncharacterized protein n=1 Tax=Trypanosoma congolense (strain IL3000) TaxID=1068625 RepID=F9WCW2_TRYCI|nr:hypothetical protein, unlikely [Trypanosoma congolense IL3000]
MVIRRQTNTTRLVDSNATFSTLEKQSHKYTTIIKCTIPEKRMNLKFSLFSVMHFYGVVSWCDGEFTTTIRDYLDLSKINNLNTYLQNCKHVPVSEFYHTRHDHNLYDQLINLPTCIF